MGRVLAVAAIPGDLLDPSAVEIRHHQQAPEADHQAQLELLELPFEGRFDLEEILLGRRVRGEGLEVEGRLEGDVAAEGLDRDAGVLRMAGARVLARGPIVAQRQP